MLKPSESIATYLDLTGWSQRELAQRAGVDPAGINRVLTGARGGKVGRLLAMALERATTDAYSRGDTKVPPLRAVDLLHSEAA